MLSSSYTGYQLTPTTVKTSGLSGIPMSFGSAPLAGIVTVTLHWSITSTAFTAKGKTAQSNTEQRMSEMIFFIVRISFSSFTVARTVIT